MYGLDGAPLGSFDPASLANHGLATSGDGRFFAAASFTADVKARRARGASLQAAAHARRLGYAAVHCQPQGPLRPPACLAWALGPTPWMPGYI